MVITIIMLCFAFRKQNGNISLYRKLKDKISRLTGKKSIIVKIKGQQKYVNILCIAFNNMYL